MRINIFKRRKIPEYVQIKDEFPSILFDRNGLYFANANGERHLVYNDSRIHIHITKRWDSEYKKYRFYLTLIAPAVNVYEHEVYPEFDQNAIYLYFSSASAPGIEFTIPALCDDDILRKNKYELENFLEIEIWL